MGYHIKSLVTTIVSYSVALRILLDYGVDYIIII
jgi:hypothetical protein